MDLESIKIAAPRVLIVEDGEATQLILKSALERFGAIVECASNGAEAISIFDRKRPAFTHVFTDLVMEGGDGFSVIEHVIRSDSPLPPRVIAMSATVSPEVVEKCERLGLKASILRKPFKLEILKDILAQSAEMPPVSSGAHIEDQVHSSLSKRRITPDQGLRDLPFDAPIATQVASAIRRCGDDLELYESLVSRLQEALPNLIESIYVAKHHGAVDKILSRVHKIKGDALNLGLESFAHTISDVEVALRSGLVPEQMFQSLSDSVNDVIDLSDQILDYLKTIDHTTSATMSEAELSSLVSMLEEGDPNAVIAVSKAKRVLPKSYSSSDDQRFRQCVSSLEFEAAKAILKPDHWTEKEPSTESGRPKILLVDDDPKSIHILTGILAPIGNLRFALSGEAALDLCRKAIPDLVIADVNMEGMSGVELCRLLKSNLMTGSVPVIIVSSSNDPHTEAMGLIQGAIDFIEKPFNEARVINRVSAHLDMARRNREIESLLLESVGSAVAGFLLCDSNGFIVDIGSDLSRALCRSRESVIGKFIFDLFPTAGGRSPGEVGFKQSLADGRIGPLDVQLPQSRGGYLPGRLFGRSISSLGREALWIKVEDTQHRIRQQQEQIEIEKARGLFSITAGLAHQFNNLSALILGNLEEVHDSLNRADNPLPFLSAAHEAAERVALISKAMLSATQLERVANESPVKVSQLLHSLRPFLKSVVSVDIDFDLVDHSANRFVAIDYREFRTSLLALVENANTACNGTGTIKVSANIDPGLEKAPDMVVISVSDTGIGMTEENSRRAMEPFFTTNAAKHIGLGLTAVQSFALRHNGSLVIESKIGQGTKVSMRLPSVPEIQDMAD